MKTTRPSRFRVVGLSLAVAGVVAAAGACKKPQSVSQTLGDEPTPQPPDLPTEPRDQPGTAPTIDDSTLFWKGTLSFVEAQKVPAYLIRWNMDNKTAARAQENGGASYVPLWRSLRVATINFNRSVSAGRGEQVLKPERQPLGLIYNEAFHAWFHQYAQNAEACKPLLDTMRLQTQFAFDKRPWEFNLPPPLEMAEEAMSEMIGGLIDAWSEEMLKSGTKTIPNYETARTVFHLTLTPEHNDVGERWSSPDKVRRAAGQVMTESLFTLTLGVIERGCDPAP
jgi:hypothetical protein